MTVVARFYVNKQPLIIGDLLISGPVAPGAQVELPFGDLTYFDRRQREPKALCQKIALVADNIVLAWAGNHAEAVALIGDLKFRTELEHFNSQRVFDYLQRQPKSIWQEIRLAGFVYDDEIANLATIGCACPTIETPEFGTIGLLGTGSASFEEHFRVNVDVPSLPDQNPLTEAVSYGLSSIGNFLAMELFGPSSLAYHFGGGYELSTLVDGKFTKLSDILYAFWNTTIDWERKTLSLRKGL